MDLRKIRKGLKKRAANTKVNSQIPLAERGEKMNCGLDKAGNFNSLLADADGRRPEWISMLINGLSPRSRELKGERDVRSIKERE